MTSSDLQARKCRKNISLLQILRQISTSKSRHLLSSSHSSGLTYDNDNDNDNDNDKDNDNDNNNGDKSPTEEVEEKDQAVEHPKSVGKSDDFLELDGNLDGNVLIEARLHRNPRRQRRPIVVSNTVGGIKKVESSR